MSCWCMPMPYSKKAARQGCCFLRSKAEQVIPVNDGLEEGRGVAAAP